MDDCWRDWLAWQNVVRTVWVTAVEASDDIRWRGEVWWERDALLLAAAATTLRLSTGVHTALDDFQVHQIWLPRTLLRTLMYDEKAASHPLSTQTRQANQASQPDTPEPDSQALSLNATQRFSLTLFTGRALSSCS